MQSPADLPVPNTINRGEKGEMSISTYTDRLATKEEIAVGMAKLCSAFPKMESGFWSILAERIVANNFTQERIKQSVEYVLDNFQYKELNIADVIKFDKRVKLYTGNEFMNAQSKGIPPSEFEKREMEGKIYWVLKEDLIKAGLK
jgi:hypothetical protein